MTYADFPSALSYAIVFGKKIRRARWSEGTYVHRSSDRLDRLVTTRRAPFIAASNGYMATSEEMLADDWEEYKPEPTYRFEGIGNFQCALSMLKAGGKVRREGWAVEGKPYWVEISDGPATCPGPLALRLFGHCGKNHGSMYSPGPEDLFADDWQQVIVE